MNLSVLPGFAWSLLVVFGLAYLGKRSRRAMEVPRRKAALALMGEKKP
ncbi:MAG: hypothetical protein NT137_03060 [Methanomassiliicoccales archaeon]|nr:hypothetical protein [Methanomassiliicoccales archaeon]